MISRVSPPWLREGLSSFYVRLQIVIRVAHRKVSGPALSHSGLSQGQVLEHNPGKKISHMYVNLMVQTGFQQRTRSFTRGQSVKLYGFSHMCFDLDPVRVFQIDTLSCFFPLLDLVAKPLLSQLTITHVTWGSVSISWKARNVPLMAFVEKLGILTTSEDRGAFCACSVPHLCPQSSFHLPCPPSWADGRAAHADPGCPTTTGISWDQFFTFLELPLRSIPKKSLAPHFSSS